MAPTSAQRRAFFRHACKGCVGIAALVQGTAKAQEVSGGGAPGAAPARFARPAIDTDEGGLWSLMDREESRMRRSPFVNKDAQLNAYLQDLACRLGGEHCPDIRVYVVRTPLFNATMAPNGMMQVWSGLLLRMDNEAQLAAVLGHEIGHYYERHTVERLRDMRSRAAFAQFIGMFGLVGAIGQLGVLAGAFGFSRDQETRADRIGVELMRRAGYDCREAASVWDNLTGELKITGGEEAGKKSPMFATHPPTLTRRDELLRLAGASGGHTNEAEFQSAVAPHRMAWLQDEVRRGQYEESLVLFDRMLKRRPEDAQMLYARAEALRLRSEKGDFQAAVADLERAVLMPSAPAESFRSLGLLRRQTADVPAAVHAFEKYLEASPQAADAGLIKSYLTELKP